MLFFEEVILGFKEKCKIVYADDLKLYAAVDSLDDCAELQGQLNIFMNWCTINKLTVSIAKCSVITVRRKA